MQFMLLPLYVLCSKIEKKSGLWLKICWCVVCAVFVTSLHTTHYRSKMVKSRIFCPHVFGLSHFEDLKGFKKYFSVYPALLVANC